MYKDNFFLYILNLELTAVVTLDRRNDKQMVNKIVFFLLKEYKMAVELIE